MRIFTAAIGLGSYLAVMAGGSLAPVVASADEVTYVACNRYDECWRVHHRYDYPADAGVTFYDGSWYDAHARDARWHWMNDPADDRGWYDQDGAWRSDPGARALAGGAGGAAAGAAIGCVVTIAIGCAPGAAIGAAVGGGTGAVAGAASTPPPPPAPHD
ncbi:MAG TPA: hypothetical protein VGL58_09775 [Caulobacteraceae bacterium]|jgi:hypothetical protein